MAVYLIGNYLHEARRRRKLTQEELTDGICSPGTLSRIERHSQAPSLGTCKALMERLGEATHHFYLLTDAKELHCYQKSRKILRLLANNQTKKAQQLYQRSLYQVEHKNVSDEQLAIYIETICDIRAGKEPEQAYQTLRLALQMTMPGWEVQDYETSHFLTSQEMLLLNGIAVQKRKQGRVKEAFEILDSLRSYIEQHLCDEEEKFCWYPVILCNIAVGLNASMQHEEACELCKSAIKSCVDGGKLMPLPYLLHQKAHALHALGRTKEADIIRMQEEVLRQILQYEKSQLAEEILIAI